MPRSSIPTSLHAQLTDVSTPHVAAGIATNAVEYTKLAANIQPLTYRTHVVETAFVNTAQVTLSDLPATDEIRIDWVMNMDTLDNKAWGIRFNNDAGAKYDWWSLTGVLTQNSGYIPLSSVYTAAGGGLHKGHIIIERVVGSNVEIPATLKIVPRGLGNTFGELASYIPSADISRVDLINVSDGSLASGKTLVTGRDRS